MNAYNEYYMYSNDVHELDIEHYPLALSEDKCNEEDFIYTRPAYCEGE